MKEIIKAAIKLFFIDTGILLGLLLILFFIFVLIKAIQNGKEHRVTEDNIISYCAARFPYIIGKYIKNILKWGIIIYIIHLFINIFGIFTEYIKTAGTYEKTPLLAFIIDTIKALSPVFTPFIVPVIVILSVIILVYSLFTTFYQISKNETEHKKLVNIVQTVEKSTISKMKLLPAPDNCKLSEEYKDDFKVHDTELKNDIIYSPSKKELFFYFCENIQKAFFHIVKYIPKILLVILVCTGINSLFVSIQNVKKIVENQKKIQELHMTIKNLSKSEAFVRITLLKEEFMGSTQYPLKKYKIEILSDDGSPIPSQTQEISLRGNEIFIDTININFDYSEIAQGDKYNIAYPYRVYSETMSPDKAVPLQCMYEDGKNYPVIYNLEESEIYGMENNVFYTRLEEVFNIIKDEDLSKEMGIRSIAGIADHFIMQKNEIRDVCIEGTGGISVKKHESLLDENDA